MRYASLAGITGVGAATLAVAIAQALAQAPGGLMGAADITAALKGMICTTKAGARFTFTDDGHYAYDGLWTNSGHYSVGNGAIIVELDNGLGRSFAISRKGDVFYMEQTAISCVPAQGTTARGAVLK